MNTMAKAPPSRDKKAIPGGGTPRGDGICLARAFCHGIHTDVHDASVQEIEVEVLDPESMVFRNYLGISKTMKDFQDKL